jgi:hypothetical protein
VDERDRRFLNEYIGFSGLNHVVAAVALFRAGAGADATASRVEELVRHQSSDEATETARRLNTGARVQSIVVGRLLAELIAAIEDVAAFAWAIRERDRGLLTRFIKSSVGEAAQFLDLALHEPPADLAELLRLPPIPLVESRMGLQPPGLVGKQYRALELSLRELGRAYRDVGSRVAVTSASGSSDDQIHVLLDIGDAAPDLPEGKVRGVLPEALNKLKHRFMLVADVVELGRLPGPTVRYAHIGRDPKTVNALFDRVVYVASIGIQLAVLMKLLADAGLDDPPRLLEHD